MREEIKNRVKRKFKEVDIHEIRTIKVGTKKTELFITSDGKEFSSIYTAEDHEEKLYLDETFATLKVTMQAEEFKLLGETRWLVKTTTLEDMMLFERKLRGRFGFCIDEKEFKPNTWFIGTIIKDYSDGEEDSVDWVDLDTFISELEKLPDSLFWQIASVLCRKRNTRC